MSIYDQFCRNCRWFHVCPVRVNGATCKAWIPNTQKVRPRRLCDFCERSKFVLGGLGRYSMTMGHTVSIDAQKDTMNNTSTTLTVTKKGAAIEDEYFPIKFCPLCGRKLAEEGKK